jgi:hypothetical protein
MVRDISGIMKHSMFTMIMYTLKIEHDDSRQARLISQVPSVAILKGIEESREVCATTFKDLSLLPHNAKTGCVGSAKLSLH